MWIANAHHSREIDRRTAQEYGVPAVVLMERAGLAVYEAVCELLPEGGSITVFCGKGNNGGDGFVAARHALEHDYHVECLVAAPENELTQEAATQLSIARAQGVQPIFYGDARWCRRSECLGSRDLIVDALVGTGSKGRLEGPILESVRAINRSGVPVVSVDVPSGIHTDTGEELGESVWALRTVTFGLPKPFLFQGIGLEHSGFWSVAEIGFPNVLLNEPTDAQLVESDWVISLLPERLKASHKGENGHLLILAGSDKMPGAASLAARSALRAGAGLVTVAGVEEVCRAVAANVPEAILLPLPSQSGVLSPEAVNIVLDMQPRYHAALFGPGLTHEEPVLETLQKIWARWEVPSCIDADALNAVSEGVSLPAGNCVLTPHPGEMSRLLHRSIAEIQADRFSTVRNALKSLGKTVLLKGPYSIVGEDGNPLMVNSTGNPGMASGGMGDVLGGVITTLLAQELPPYCAACCGMFWQGLAGDLCAETIGTIGYTATEVADSLPKARAKLAGCCKNLRDA